MIRRLLAIVALIYLLGFALYAVTLPRPREDGATDAIVVPTGGAGRIDRGLALIQAHKAKRMLISGAGRGVRPIDLALKYKVPVGLFQCCIDIGTDAADTRGNASETAGWVSKNGFASVRLVTSDWHMARARMELEAALGDKVQVIDDAVQGDAELGVLIVEYNKLIWRRFALWFGING